MGRKVMVAAFGLATLAFILTIALIGDSLAASATNQLTKQGKRAGLTQSGIVMAREAGRNQTGRVTMRPQTSLGRLQQATRLGPHAPQASIKLAISLKLRNTGELKRFLHEVQNPRSPLYHQFLTPTAFTAKYGPTKAQVAAVARFLKGYGIKVTDVSANRILIHTEGKTVAYNRALRIMINDYELDGRHFFSTASRPKIPAELAPSVLNIIGLNNAVQMHPRSHIKPMPANADVAIAHADRPRPPAPPPATSSRYNPIQIANAYDWPSITDPANGAGVTIAVLTAQSSSLSPRDYATFWGIYRLPQNNVTVIPVGTDQGSDKGLGETLLDVEWAGAMGGAAALNVYVSGDAKLSSFTDMYNQFVTDNSAQVMTTSWGLYETASPSIVQTDEQIFMQAAAQGISMFAAAGDKGSSDGQPGDNMADYPASSAYITSANGTELRADVNGNYISEVAWQGSGGAISQLIEQPIWQHGPGVPANGWRNNSDIAMNAGPRWPYMLFSGGKFSQIYGTSAVAPQLAGLFAIAISKNNGESLGQSNKLFYGDVQAGYYTTDFRDVTVGNNGAYEAGPNWDHPTGWGSPLGKSLIDHLGVVGPSGTLSGMVTDGAGGAPVVGAMLTITPGGFHKSTGADGSYSIILPSGTYTATVSAFGYNQTDGSVTVTDGNTTTQDFTLDASPRVTLSGKVSDGSGHGYGLYASVKIKTAEFGWVAMAWTDPVTGQYSVELPKGFDYSLRVTPSVHGYESASDSVTLSADESRNFSLPVIAACTAPGYGFVSGYGEDFNGTFPPSGWTVTNEVTDSTWVWKTNEDYQEDNWTGGTGTAATVQSYPPEGQWGYGGPFDTSLVSPSLEVSSLPVAPLLAYKANYISLNGDSLDLDISVDGGAWQTILHWSGNSTFHGTLFALPGVNAGADLSAYTQGASTIQLRWRYYNPNDFGADYYVQIDDVVIGKCQPVAGGLVFGQVQDANTGAGIVGALVQDDQGDSVATLPGNPGDPNLPVGSYLLFVPSGEHALTASASLYAPSSVTVTASDNATVTQDITLDAGQLVADPQALVLHVTAGGQADDTLRIQNMGGAAADYHVLAVDLPPAPATTQAIGPFAPTPQYMPGVDLSAPNACEKGCPTTLRGLGVIRAGMPGSAGKPLATFQPDIRIYGLGVDRNAGDLWLGSPAYEEMRGDNKDHRYLFDGTDTGDAIDVSAFPEVVYMADMAFNDATGMLWQVSLDKNPVGSHIYELDPATLAPTGRSIAVPSPQPERGLAYDPLTSTWYAGDFHSGDIYHFDNAGTLLDSAFVKLPVQGLAYNSATGHLFVLTSGGEHAVYVLDAKNGYAQVGYFDIPNYDPQSAGAGFDYDCDGALWISSFDPRARASRVWKVESGESGWCAFKGIPWLTLTPEAGSVAAGVTTSLSLMIDGTGQKKSTSSEVQLRLVGNTPYPVQVIPVTVYWDAATHSVDLVLTGGANADSVKKGDKVIYSLKVENAETANHAAATQTVLSYQLPEGVSYVAASGDNGVVCAPPASGVVICQLGTLAQGASKNVTIAVEADSAGMLTSHFEVKAHEPDEAGHNTLDVTTTVTGEADISASAEEATVKQGQTGSMHLSVANAGPDPATDVKFEIGADANVELKSATSGQGQCALSGSGIVCELGEIDSGAQVDVEVSITGTNKGSAQVTATATTTADDPDSGNNVATAAVTVEASSDGGGGALDWLALAALLGLGLTAAIARGRHPRR